jgi:RNA 2',3'-cyclic 3'-phosphodiesterase
MRYFLAIDLPPEVRAALGRPLAALPEVRGLSKTRAENLHVTVRFLGELDAAKQAGVQERVREVLAPVAPFELALAALGAFPSADHPRVVWAGLTDAAERAARLGDAVNTALDTVPGLPPRDERPFQPHITLARCKTPAAIRAARGFLRQADPLPRLACPVTRLALYQSELAPAGPRYTAVDHWPLGA